MPRIIFGAFLFVKKGPSRELEMDLIEYGVNIVKTINTPCKLCEPPGC